MRDRALKVSVYALYPNFLNIKGIFLETTFLQFVGRIEKNLLNRSRGNFRYVKFT